jgi:outer membrane receptor protein involved in Fe transport
VNALLTPARREFLVSALRYGVAGVANTLVGNGTAQIKDGVELYANIGNVFDKKAPIAPGAYASAPNFLTTWHYAGLVGRTFKVGVRFEY